MSLRYIAHCKFSLETVFSSRKDMVFIDRMLLSNQINWIFFVKDDGYSLDNGGEVMRILHKRHESFSLTTQCNNLE